MNTYNKTVGELATKNPVTTFPDEIMTNISQLFSENSFHHLPVIAEGGICVGMISKTDFYQLQDCFTKSKTGNYKKNNELLFRSLLASDVMTKKLVFLHPNAPLIDAIDIFLENRVHSIAVVNNNVFVGILTPYDILNGIKEGFEVPDAILME